MVSANKDRTIVEVLNILRTREGVSGPSLQGHAAGWVRCSQQESSFSEFLISK